MSIQHVAAVLDARDERITGTRKLVLITLANRTNEHGKCWPSQGLLAGECGISVRALADHLKALESDGFIKRSTQHLGKGNGSRTTYTLHLAMLKVAPEEIAGAEVAPASFVGCTGSTPHVTNHQEPTISNSNELDLGDTPPEQPKRKAAPRGAARGTRISENWAPTPKDYAYASSKGVTPEEINNEAERFRNHWVSAIGKGSTKRDWSAAWRNWIIGQYGIVERKRQAAERAASHSRRNGGKLSAFERLDQRLAEAANGHQPRFDDERGESEGYTIDAEATRLAG